MIFNFYKKQWYAEQNMEGTKNDQANQKAQLSDYS